MRILRLAAILALIVPSTSRAADANRLTYLDDSDPYYVSRGFPKLVTPQWIGEEGVEAVVILSIDDMRDPKQYETVLRPILDRLKRIDGRAPVSIMTCQIAPKVPQLQAWLKEGLSLEVHTINHPCPLLQGGDFAKAKATYDRCTDLMAEVPNNRPVAFRMPCCDSQNTLSPRFHTEIFDRTTPKGNFLTIDSSVFNFLTSNDPELPRELVVDADGRDRFLKYEPAGRSFVNSIENYPYPYVIGRLCWEFPCVAPSDWQAQHLHKPNNPITVADWKAALDATVLKQGVFTMVFHPWNWGIQSERAVDLIDHVVAKHGKKVKFLTFREAQERLDKNLLGGQPLRDPKTGLDNGVRLLDVNNDGFIDVVIGNDKVKQTRLWSPKTQSWTTLDFPAPLVANNVDAGARFGVFREDGAASLVVRNETTGGAWHFNGKEWEAAPCTLSSIPGRDRAVYSSRNGRDAGVRFRDVNRSGSCQLIVANDQLQEVFDWDAGKKTWTRQASLPAGAAVVDADGKDNGLRFADIDEDGYPDILLSNEREFGLYLYDPVKRDWSRKVLFGKPGDKNALPMIARKGTNNGAWFHSRSLWVQNEDTAVWKDLVERRSFNEMLESVEPTAKSPQASLRALRPRTGFVAEQMAAEPLVQSPIAFAWGPDGKLWVVEMGDYPLGVDGKGKPGGRIKCLEDTQGTGVYDKATLFLDGLAYPTGVMPWRKGVLITCAPDILYAEDAKGTGKADRVEVLFTGFTKGNPQHRVNSPVWGLDNWIYCANGDSGGKIQSKRTGQQVDIFRHDFRIRPDEGTIDLQAGQTQYGRSRDDWNNWFGNNNSNPMYHFALADHYLRRNPHIAPPANSLVPVSVTPGTAQVYPISRTLPRFNQPEGANHFTSACSAIVYRDDLFGPAFAQSTFVSEPVHNLVHREIVSPLGTSFTSRRAPDERSSEFLASSDNWFRPTMLQTGPDGALWVADMYRQVIEHPQWIPKDWQKRLDLRAGHDKGRIYRVYPAGVKPRPIPRLDKLDTAGLVVAFDSPSGWQRDLAQQMLLWQQSKEAGPLLEKLAQTSARPLARLHALCTLDGLHALQPALLQRALTDADPGIRRHAVRLCEPHLAKSPELGAAIVKLAADPDPQVRLQVAYTLGEWNDPQAAKALGQLALKDADDRFIAAAVMSSINAKNLEGVMDEEVLLRSQHDPAGRPPAALVENLLRLAHALNQTRALAVLLTAATAPVQGEKGYTAWHYTTLAGLLDALDQKNSSLAQLRAKAEKSKDEKLDIALKGAAMELEAARALAADPKAAQADRLQALRLLGRGLDRQAEDRMQLADLLAPQNAPDVQAAAVAALGRLRDSQVPELLLHGWKGHGPALRAQVLDVLFLRNDWLKAAVAAIERKEIAAAEIDSTRRQRLLQHKDVSIRQQAAKLFAGSINPDRQKVVDAYQPVLAIPGDPGRGAQLFSKNCAVCHKLGERTYEGGKGGVGPDLASLGDKSPPFLLVSILDPNQAVEARYVNYRAVTKDGQSFEGVLAAESGNSITLVKPDGKPETILRGNLDELVSTGKSAMPEGLEKEIKPQDMADLIAHIRGPAPGQK